MPTSPLYDSTCASLRNILPAQPLATTVPETGVIYLPGMYLTEARTGPVKRGYRRLVDARAPCCWKTSLFQLGESWLERQHNALQLPPIFWSISDEPGRAMVTPCDPPGG